MKLCRLIPGEIYFHTVSIQHYRYCYPKEFGYQFLNLHTNQMVTLHLVDIESLQISLLDKRQLRRLSVGVRHG